MPTFRQGDVIKVPFPYTDRPTRQSRPAVVVSTGGIEELHGLIWVTMVTSAENRGWPGDVVIGNLAMAGLPAASVIRTAKIATIEAGDATRLGRLSAPQRRQVVERLVWELAPGTPRS
jgi:mRNA interferase MazF